MKKYFYEGGDNMGDNLDIKDGRDSSKININEPWEVNYWKDKLNVTEEKLKDVVEKVGPVVDDVKKELDK